jgi:hypothetical protein
MAEPSAQWAQPSRQALLEQLASRPYKLSLHREKLPATTKAYSTATEISAPGYTKGGQAIPSVQVKVDEKSVYLQFSGTVSWKASTISAQFGQIYSENETLIVFDFGTVVHSTQDEFKIPLGEVRLTLFEA